MAAAAPAAPGESRAGPWFPLLVFGVLAAVSLPLSVLASPPAPATGLFYAPDAFPTVTRAIYLGGGFAAGPFAFPLGWYWVGALIAGLLLTAAWYRRHDRRAASPAPLRSYLVTGLALASVTAALPLLAWGTPVRPENPGIITGWAWLAALWELGPFALAGIGVSLAILARSRHSRTLTVTAAFYAVAVCLAGWLDLQQGVTLLPAAYPARDPAVLLPAAVLLLAGLGSLLAAGLRRLRPRPEQNASLH